MSQLLGELQLEGGRVIQVRKGDLTRESVDAIVNPANEQLQNGGGAAGAISRAIGPDFQDFCDEFVEEHGPLTIGSDTMVYTPPSEVSVPFRKVISVVGPRIEYDDDKDEFFEPSEEDCDLLYSAVRNTLEAALLEGCVQISIPAISSGIFGFPKPLCATLLFECAINFIGELFRRESGNGNEIPAIREVRFTNFDDQTCGIFLAELQRLKESANA